MSRRVLVTGSAGFIGFHIAKLLLDEGCTVHGFDGMTDYYDVRLKERRHAILHEYERFSSTEAMLEDQAVFDAMADDFRPEVIIHLAAQAGVRYSIENPKLYLDTNIIGTFHVMEAARRLNVQHLMLASTSSVFGANTKMPFIESDKADTQLTIYAATKKAVESMSHAYAHLWDIPTTVFRFFTVYGAWGRPDLALFKFVDAIMNNRPIDIYNHGEMYRDFTYVEDLVRAIRLLMDAVPVRPASEADIEPGDTLSPVAPYRIVNIGNSDKVRLLDFVDAIEAEVGQQAVRNYMPMQIGDVPATWADASLLHRLTGYSPATPVKEGIAHFVAWYRDYYGK